MRAIGNDYEYSTVLHITLTIAFCACILHNAMGQMNEFRKSQAQRLLTRQLNRYEHGDTSYVGQTHEVVQVVQIPTLHEHLDSQTHRFDSKEIQEQHEKLRAMGNMIRGILHDGGILAEGYTPLTALKPDFYPNQPLRQTRAAMLSRQMGIPLEEGLKMLRTSNPNGKIFLLQPGLDEKIRHGQSARTGMTFKVEETDITGIIDALTPLVSTLLGEDYPITARTVIVQYLARFAKENKNRRERQEYEAKRRTQPEVNIPEELKGIELHKPRQRVYRGTIARVGETDYTIKRDTPPEPGYSEDYYDAERTNPYLVVDRLDGQSRRSKTESVIVRGDLYEELVAGRVVVKMRPYDISQIPPRDPQGELVLRIMKEYARYNLTPQQIAKITHMSVADVQHEMQALQKLQEKFASTPTRR